MSAASPVTSPRLTAPRKTGFALWMERVLEGCDRAEVSFATDPVHDLRVALRRCRSLADGLMSIDPSQEWKSMKRAGKKVFQSLGELRDVQVMEEWVSRLGDSNDPVGAMMLHYLAGRESELKVHAAGELHDFDRKQWRHWGVTLPRRAAKVRPGSLVFKHLALERWTEAYELHRKALRNGSKIALHSLRIGIKRFRYTVENFLPEEHAAWKDDLKEMQDILGEVHDLDVFWATALQVGVFQDPESRSRWHEKIASERQARIEKYRAKMLGPKSLWHLWRAALPSGELAAKGAMQRLRLWGSFLDADPKHSTQVTRLALQLFDQLSLKAVNQPEKRHTPREILEVASFLHNANPEKMHPRQKTKRCKPARLIRKMKPPLGWASEDIELVAAVVRHLRGGLPRAGRKSIAALTPPQRKMVAQLAGILRLADAFDFNHDARIQRLRVTPDQNLLIIEAEGYSSRDRMAQALATARHLLETICRRPILIRTLRTAGPSRRSVSPSLHAA